MLAFTIAPLLFALPSVKATERGLAWATDNSWAPTLGDKPLVSWYYHWENGPIKEMPNKNEYVPLFWGTEKWNSWSDRVSEMKKEPPKHLLGFNEPDISSQANMDPYTAADIWMQQIHPWAAKGAKLGSPAVAWNLDWLDTFLDQLKKKGGHVDFICLHWYGGAHELSRLEGHISDAHKRFGKNIWVTEVGVTTASNPSQQDVKNFMTQSITWMSSVGYVERVAWFGCFTTATPPDGFASGKNALFQSPNKLSDLGYWYSYDVVPSRRSIASMHHKSARVH